VKIELKKILLSDAKRYFEILNHPDFHYFPAKPVSIKYEREFLKKLHQARKDSKEYAFAITANKKIVGAAGIKIKGQPHICNIGFFIDRRYWNKGIVTKAVELLEKFIDDNLDIVRVEICMAKKNIGCRKVATKSGYTQEGIMKKFLKVNDKYHDCYLYAKILK
jgi:ribosomal-protein-alanine N-acetyltransferase